MGNLKDEVDFDQFKALFNELMVPCQLCAMSGRSVGGGVFESKASRLSF